LGNLDVNGDLTISGSASFNMNTNNDSLTLAGDWLNTSTNANFFNDGTEKVTFDGTADQDITALVIGTETFFLLEINKASGSVILNDDVLIDGSLTFTSGDIVSTTTDLLSVDNNATVSGASDNSHVNGPVRKVGNDAFTFPTGDGTTYRSIAISAPSVASDQFDAQYFSSSAYRTYGGWGSWNTTINRVSNIEHWTLDRTNGTSSVSVTLSWGSTSGVGDTADLIVARYNTGTTMWEDQGVAAKTGTTSAGTITSNAVANFSPFALGTTLPSNPLPIILGSFGVTNHDDHVDIEWKATESLVHDRFMLERSTDGQNFEAISTKYPDQYLWKEVDFKAFHHEDLDAQDGWNYYRLLDLCKRNTNSFRDKGCVHCTEDESSGSFHLS